MAYARADLVSGILSKYGILYQADTGPTRTRADLVTEAYANMGFTYQADNSPPRTRVDWVNETLYRLGVVQQADGNPPRTQAELIQNVLFVLGVLAAGQTASAEDTNAIDIRINTIVADLNARMIVTVNNAYGNNIPAAYFDALSSIIANVCKDKYGAVGDEAAKLEAIAAMAEAKLKTLSRTGLVDELLPQIVGDLNARVIVTIANINAIPGAWFSALADIAAEACKHRFDIVPPERSAEIATKAQLAERRLQVISNAPLVDEKIPQIIADLNARQVATVSDLNNIPAAWFSALAAIVADSVKGKFDELPQPTIERLIVEAQAAERRLKNLNRAAVVDKNVDTILADLAARNVVILVDDTDIPQEWFRYLVSVGAEYCKDMDMGLDMATKQQMSAEGETAVMRLRELSRGRPSYLPLQATYY